MGKNGCCGGNCGCDDRGSMSESGIDAVTKASLEQHQYQLDNERISTLYGIVRGLYDAGMPEDLKDVYGAAKDQLVKILKNG